ncbi:hypothetical protein [Promicromonospora sp. NPDC023987]|uniref:hypothetical protein n=1 Tax=Promicromonospora sp. NPDC023987 TaxID=3155360 RepID=UPI0033E2E3A8
MADGTESQVSDGSSADNPQENHTQGTHAQEVHAHQLNADPGRVARIVAALRTAHAADTAATAETSDTAEILDPPAPRRETSGVRPAKPPVPTLRWNPGSRYRASRLANRPALQTSPASSAGPTGGHAPVPPGPAPGPAPSPGVTAQAPPAPSAPPIAPPPPPPPPAPQAPPAGHGAAAGATVHAPVPAPPALAGRLYRGPARRTGVFEREIWYPVAQSSRVPRDVGEALIAAVERYRKGSISTSGLVRAIGRAHAA